MLHLQYATTIATTERLSNVYSPSQFASLFEQVFEHHHSSGSEHASAALCDEPSQFFR